MTAAAGRRGFAAAAYQDPFRETSMFNRSSAWVTAVILLGGLAGCAGTTSVGDGGAGWQKELQTQLPLLGHRNWIVVVDSAYPWQTSPGVQTIASDRSQVETVKVVLAALAGTRHVAADIYTDAELPFVSEADAPGVEKYRKELAAALAGKNVKSLPHEEIIAKLDKAGQTFHVLLIKTDMTLPYTSVFMELGCGYWNAGAENRLRGAMAK